MRAGDSEDSGIAWEAWHAAHDAVVTHATNSAQVGVSMGALAGGASILYEIGQVAESLAMKVISTVIITTAAAVVGFFVPRYLARRFPPSVPTPPVQQRISQPPKEAK